MDKADSQQLLAATRPPPTGQDSCDLFQESEDAKQQQATDFNDAKPFGLSAGTPRKLLSEHRKATATLSTHDACAYKDVKAIEEEHAPLGFEPEGSVAQCKYQESSSSNLLTLLHTSNGRHLFRDFLVQSHQEGLLNCWLACYNYRSNAISWSALHQAFDRYVLGRESKLPLQEATRVAVEDCLGRNVVADQRVVDRVERELWSALNSEWYHKFVNSNYYTAYCTRPETTKRETRSKKPDLQTLLEGKPNSSAQFQSSKQPLESFDDCHGQGSNAKASSRSRDCNCKAPANDNLPVPSSFVPVTQQPAQVAKQALRPEELMRQLIPKLEVLSLERALVNIEDELAASKPESHPHSTSMHGHHHDARSHFSEPTTGSTWKDNQSCADSSSLYSGPSYSRYSVAGVSTKSCPEHSRKYKDGAKELASAVHLALRTKLHSDFNSGESSVTTPSCQSSGRGAGSHTHKQCCCRQPVCTNAAPDYDPRPAPVQPATNRRIMEWMERNAEHATEGSESSFGVGSLVSSPSVHRKHRQPVAYDTSRPSSCKPQSTSAHHYDRIHESNRSTEHYGKSHSHHRPSSRSHRHSHSSSNNHHAAYADSTTSGHWTASDSASSHMAPSVVSSSVPSSASRLWPETKLNFHQYDHHSGAGRSGSSHKSHSSASNNSHSHTSSASTTVTYYMEKEPIPYRSTLPRNATLAEFKRTIAKKGTFRYFFKTTSKDDDQTVYQEVTDDGDPLPRYQKHIVVKVVSH